MCIALSSWYLDQNENQLSFLGPCPPCYQVHRPPQPCFCGKETRLIKCADFDPESTGWSCGQPCSSPLTCNIGLLDEGVRRHTCQETCHPGSCPPCQIQETVSCFCGKHLKDIRCSDIKEPPKPSRIIDGNVSRSCLGFYQCEEVCGR